MISNNTKVSLNIWTDGSCDRISKLGGIGVYIRYGEKEKKIGIGYNNTTIGRMEIKAVIVALSMVKRRDVDIFLYSDSQYVVKSINLWIEKWKTKGWHGIKNVDLW